MSEKKGIVLTKKKAAVLAVVMLLLVAGGVILGLNGRRWFGGGESSTEAIAQPDLDENAVAWQGQQSESQAGEAQAGIAIPGYKSITLRAGQTEQSVNLHNPEYNDCYFVMSLALLMEAAILAASVPFTPVRTVQAAEEPEEVVQEEAVEEAEKVEQVQTNAESRSSRTFTRGTYTLTDESFSGGPGESGIVIDGNVTLIIEGTVTATGGGAYYTSNDYTIWVDGYGYATYTDYAAVGAGAEALPAPASCPLPPMEARSFTRWTFARTGRMNPTWRSRPR